MEIVLDIEKDNVLMWIKPNATDDAKKEES